MTITNKKKIIKRHYYLGSEKLIQKDFVKYLGVTIDKNLTFGQHIKEKIKSATTTLNMLRRNLYHAPKSVKMKAYISCVLPILEYASTSWQPTSEKSNNSLEMVQHNAARFISNSYIKKGEFKRTSISEILNYLQLDTLEERRTKMRLNMAYKIINGYVILDSNLLPKARNTGRQRECNAPKVGIDNQLIEPPPGLKTTSKTFFYSVPKLSEQAEAPSVDAFKEHFNN